MRLVDLITEDLHQTMAILNSDAESLARGEHPELGKIELNPGWKDESARLIHRYDKLVDGLYRSFNDPEGDDEVAWMQAHFRVTYEFLLKHGLATEVDDGNV